MRPNLTTYILIFLVLALSSFASGCGGLEAPPPPTVTRVPTETPTVEVAVQEDTPAVEATAATSEVAATLAPSATVAPAAPTAVPAAPTPTSASTPAPELAPVAATVRDGPLNVRAGPGSAYASLGQLETGSEVEIVGRDDSGSWWQVVYPDGEAGLGWVSATYVETVGPVDVEVVEVSATSPAPQEAMEYMAATVRDGPLNVRSGPGSAYPRLGQLSTGAELEITGRDESTSWWQIVYPEGEGGRGWVSAAHVETAEPVAVEVVQVSSAPPTSAPQAAAGFTGKVVFQESSGGRIFIVGANGVGLHQLTNGLDPALSPDGAQVAFTRWTNPAGIYLINVDGTGERLLSRVEQAKSPEWSPDGSKIIFSHRSGGSWDYYRDTEKQVVIKQEDAYWVISVADVETGQFADLSTENHSFSPSWSPDGWWAVYDGEKGLMLADPTGESDRWRQVTYGVRDMSPDWSPQPADDAWAAPIAYMVFQNDHWEIHTIMPNGQGQKRVTAIPMFEASYDNVAPDWSPDGVWIAYLTDRRGSWEIWVVRPDGSQQQPLLSAAQLEGISFRYEAQSEQVLDWGS